MKSLKLASLAAFLIALISTSPRALAANSFPSDHIVVMISVDGLAAHYFDDPKAEMPNIRALATAGARAKSMKAVTPTVTWPNHTTLVTGVMPAVHGVVGNNYYDRTTNKKVTLISDPTYDKVEIVKVPTIYDVAKQAGLKTAAIRWPATRNAPTLDWTVPDVKLDTLLNKYSTPALQDECAQAGIKIFNVNAGNERSDEPYAQTFNLILHQHRPQLALLHLIMVDHIQHYNGPRSPEAYAAIKEADAQVGEVMAELKKDYPGKATVLIVSDHGFSPLNHMILPNVILRQAGLEKQKGDKGTSSAVEVVSQAGSALLYVRDGIDRAAILDKVTKTFRKITGVASILDTAHFKDFGVADPKTDPHAPDLILFAQEGYAFGDTAAGELPFNDKPERKGSHGHNPALPDLHATFVAWGVGIKAGVKLGEIQNTSVAPTLAKLLHLSLPASVTAAPLSTILAE